jgi:hypothetical protein
MARHTPLLSPIHTRLTSRVAQHAIGRVDTREAAINTLTAVRGRTHEHCVRLALGAVLLPLA